MNKQIESLRDFRELELTDPVLRALKDVGYESPTPIQAETIPPMLAGRDVLGQAQTGTGKTAAFALPLLCRLDLKAAQPQVLVLAPTRELAIQVAEAFQTYASHLKGFHVMPIYGGQDYGVQLRQLKRGVQVVVGTPGRVMDHMRRGSLTLDGLQCLVLDEADEMLRMGFIDDVEWILEQTPEARQIALFSATMSAPIRRIAQRYLKDPVEVTIKMQTAAADTVRQRYWMVSGLHKLDALTRILEGESIDGAIVFVRTKTSTMELAEKLEARGYACAPLNGDIAQSSRERTVERFRTGKLDILVATDVAARGLDVDRVSHVFNYDIPHDTESYIHRIGRTGRAGRSGEAVLFVAPREKRMLRAIEVATKQRIELMSLPSTETINDKRIAAFKERIATTLAVEEMGVYYQLVEEFRQEYNVPAIEIAAALARMVQGDQPLLLANKPLPPAPEEEDRRATRRDSGKRRKSAPEVEYGMERFRIDAGTVHGVKPGNIVGAIANEAGIDGRFIGRIQIYDDYSTVDLPSDMPKAVLQRLRKTRVAGRPLSLTKFNEKPNAESAAKPAKRDGKGKTHKKNARAAQKTKR
ncbi:MAG: DEAD/DEAH box helicase [bacterium]|nr:DEAD/DEAH box helicase [bacterium]